MSIRPALRYNRSKDTIVGLEDLGEHKPPSEDTSNLLLVFMLRGNYRAWKQPVAYYLASHSVTPEVLREMLMRTLADVHAAGIEVSFVAFLSYLLCCTTGFDILL